MWKEENFTNDYITLDGVVESLEIKNKGSLVGALLNYSDYEDHIINNNLEIAHNTKEVWMNIAYALSGLLELDYTPKGNLQEYADELLDLAKFRVENNVMPNEDFTIPEIIKEVEEKIKVFTRLKYQLKEIDPKVLEETPAFIEKREKEYQKIMNETAGNYLERAIKNCPECNHTIVDLSESFSIEQVAKIIEEPEETVLNFIAAKGWIDPETKKPLLPLKYIDSNGRITVDGKDKIVSAFFTIKKTEKGMKAFSCGKGE